MNEKCKDLVQKIELAESTRLISYVLADRLSGPGASIAMDALGLFYRHLETIGKVNKIALFLYTTGGDTMVPWRLVNLIREYCDQFTVLVPYKAHSAGTLVCLGADETVMTKMAELSPIDPSVTNAFNPQGPAVPTMPPNVAASIPPVRIPISVEDVAAYFKLAKERAGLDTPESRFGALQQLTNVVHPLALGNVERSHTMIRELARKLLSLHMNLKDEAQSKRCNDIIDTLTEKLYSHQHLIPRREARDIIGLKVRYPEAYEEDILMDLFAEYKADLDIGGLFNPALELGDRTEMPKEFSLAKIETTKTEDRFLMRGKIVRASQPNQPPAVNIYDQGWRKTL